MATYTVALCSIPPVFVRNVGEKLESRQVAVATCGKWQSSWWAQQTCSSECIFERGPNEQNVPNSLSKCYNFSCTYLSVYLSTILLCPTWRNEELIEMISSAVKRFSSLLDTLSEQALPDSGAIDKLNSLSFLPSYNKNLNEQYTPAVRWESSRCSNRINTLSFCLSV